MSDLISTQEAIAKIINTAIQKIMSGEQKLTKEYEQSVIEAVNVILDTAQPQIVRCKDCLMHGVCRFEQFLGLNGFCSQWEKMEENNEVD